MKLKKLFLTSLLYCFGFTVSMFSQDEIRNQIIVKTNSIEDYNYYLSSLNGIYGKLTIDKISEDLKLFLLTFEEEIDSEGLNLLNRIPGTQYLSYNYKLEERRIPNDVSYGNQWYLDFIQMPKVWDYITGGKTKEGKEIVLAILDTGIQTNHPDLAENIFVNKSEIPNNSIDDDGNGYKDDISGINVKTNTGTHAVTFHGTWVSGVAGAKGNNSTGVAGVSWDVKILPLSDVTNVAGLLKGYDYILNMRRLYNQTNGQKGALVVATNYSGGLKNRFGTEAEFRPWCEMYDLLGAQGILSVGAPANSSIDVDVEGDMPTTCESEFLITVTSVNQMGELSKGVGYGKKHVDLGAPGENIFGLSNNSTYKSDVGTSASAPMVAGLIALLYSADCNNLDNLLKDNPRSLALALKNAILKGVKTGLSLETRSVSGGYLNAFQAFVNLQNICENQILKPSVKGDLKINYAYQSGSYLIVNYVSPDESLVKYTFTNHLGQIIGKGNFSPPQFGDKVIELDLSQFPVSVYYLTFYNSKDKVMWPFIPNGR
jgi:subtilisin family serine protease